MTLAPFDLNLRHLRALPVIAGRGSMSAAANAVSLSQPALTQGVAKLERQLGVALFDRRPNGVVPTPEGRVLAERSAAALDHLAGAAGPAGRGFARPEMLMTATQLRAFLALADAGGFASAAAANGWSQPAVHRAVRELEQVCAHPLVERRGAGVALTARGHRLARGVRLAAAEIASAIAELDPNDEVCSTLAVGAMPLSRALILPRAIARFTAEQAKVRIDVVEGSWRELIEPLLDGVLDLTVGALRNDPPRGIVQTPLMRDKLVVIGRAGHPLAATACPSLDALAAFPWIVGQSNTPLRSQWNELFASRGLPDAPIECGSVMVTRQILRESDFLTLLSPDQVALEIAAGILTRIGPPLPASARTIGISTRAGWRPTRVQARFLALIAQAAQSGVPEIQ